VYFELSVNNIDFSCAASLVWPLGGGQLAGPNCSERLVLLVGVLE
jgi:hypothetical protein